MCKQLYLHFETILSQSQCGFRKGCSVQHCLTIEKFKEVVDNGNEFSVFLTDLLKVFDCIDQSLLLEKRYGYGVLHISLKLIFSYFKS